MLGRGAGLEGEGGGAAGGGMLGCTSRLGGTGLRRSRAEKKKKGGKYKKRVFFFFKHTQTMNSNKSLNSNTQKRCTSMYATVNSYISLIN
jgi:hypothetical protein